MMSIYGDSTAGCGPGRRTVAQTIRLAGVGLHCGRVCAATIASAEPGHGISLNGMPLTIAAVQPGALATTVTTPTGPVRMVEHLLAALALHRIDDARLTVEGGEVPILDGSALLWTQKIRPTPHPGIPKFFTLTQPIHVGDAQRWITAHPAAELSVAVHVDFPGIGAQTFAESVTLKALAAARTFGFEADAKHLHAAGLALGASLENTVVFDAIGGCLNPDGLRWPDECVRHKTLDLVGDLLLLGGWLNASITTHRAGHALHHALVRAIHDHSE